MECYFDLIPSELVIIIVSYLTDVDDFIRIKDNIQMTNSFWSQDEKEQNKGHTFWKQLLHYNVEPILHNIINQIVNFKHLNYVTSCHVYTSILKSFRDYNRFGCISKVKDVEIILPSTSCFYGYSNHILNLLSCNEKSDLINISKMIYVKNSLHINIYVNGNYYEYIINNDEKIASLTFLIFCIVGYHYIDLKFL